MINDTDSEKKKKYRRCDNLVFVWWVKDKSAHISPLANPIGMGWIGRDSLEDEQAAVTCQHLRWAVISLRIEEARRSEVIIREINPRDGGVKDSILVFEDIKHIFGGEHRHLLLRKQKRKVVMEESSFTWGAVRWR